MLEEQSIVASFTCINYGGKKAVKLLSENYNYNMCLIEEDYTIADKVQIFIFRRVTHTINHECFYLLQKVSFIV